MSLRVSDSTGMQLAIEEASRFLGATAPNPPVGAVILDVDGNVLSVGAHVGAGSPHAEVCALKKISGLQKPHSLIVTLEPCNHFGKTPPCTEAILASGIRRVVIGALDPNPNVLGGGTRRLKLVGLEVVEGVLQKECEALIRPFSHWIRTGLPWVTLKRVFNREGSMIPPKGQKTFSSPDSLQLAHELRRRADALLTGSGTVLADLPEFTVRQVPDHSISGKQKKRVLMVVDRRGRVPADWIKDREAAGFTVCIEKDVKQALQFLGEKGCLEVLVEAGPALSGFILEQGIWNQEILIRQNAIEGEPDWVEERFNAGVNRK